MKYLRYIFLLPVFFYRKCISPLFPPCCKYYPTCSTYAVRAFKKHGIIKGTILSVWRILRCNPWSNGGIDPVPEKFHIPIGANRGLEQLREQEQKELEKERELDEEL